MDREEILLKEYEVCQSHNDSLAQQAWVSISILITVNMLVLAQIVPNLVLNEVYNQCWDSSIFIILLGLTMIFILVVFWRWQKRIQFLKWLNNDRMQEIEHELDYIIRKNWRVRGLDLFHAKNTDKYKENKWKELDQNLQNMIESLAPSYPLIDKGKKENENYKTKYRLPTTEGKFNKWQFKFEYIFFSLMIVWGLVLLGSIYSLLSYGYAVILVAAILITLIALFSYK